MTLKIVIWKKLFLQVGHLQCIESLKLDAKINTLNTIFKLWALKINLLVQFADATLNITSNSWIHSNKLYMYYQNPCS